MFCPDCGQENADYSATCTNCGRALQAGAPGMIHNPGGAYPAETVSSFAGKKIAAGICGILLGSLGVHKFILGLTTPGIIMLLVTILTCGLGSIVTGVIGLVEGIIYLTKTDADFYQTYAVEKKGWF
jgi:TM2 domain-containing membrane protein YozV